MIAERHLFATAHLIQGLLKQNESKTEQEKRAIYEGHF